MTATELGLSKQTLEAEAQRWSDKAKTLPTIVDAESCRNASYLLRSVKGIRSDIARWFEPHLEAAMETKRKAEAGRKGLADEQARMEAPLIAIETRVKRALLDWETAQEAVRRAEEQRLQAEAQREAETRTLDAAAAMERDAVATGDVGMAQEAADLLAQPIDTPVVSVGKLTPKVQGIVYRDQYKAHETVDVRKLAAAVGAGLVPVTFLTPNMSALNKYAGATKGLADVPGVRFYNDRSIAARG